MMHNVRLWRNIAIFWSENEKIDEIDFTEDKFVCTQNYIVSFLRFWRKLKIAQSVLLKSNYGSLEWIVCLNDRKIFNEIYLDSRFFPVNFGFQKHCFLKNTLQKTSFLNISSNFGVFKSRCENNTLLSFKMCACMFPLPSVCMNSNKYAKNRIPK